jgi:hypothetical protein
MCGGRLKEQSKPYFRALGQHISEVRKQHGSGRARPRIRGLTATVFAYELGERRGSMPMLLKLADIFTVP